MAIAIERGEKKKNTKSGARAGDMVEETRRAELWGEHESLRAPRRRQRRAEGGTWEHEPNRHAQFSAAPVHLLGNLAAQAVREDTGVEPDGAEALLLISPDHGACEPDAAGSESSKFASLKFSR